MIDPMGSVSQFGLLPRLNPLRRGFFENPYGQYAELRQLNPVHSSMGMGILTCYNDVRFALLDRTLSVEVVPNTIRKLSEQHPDAAGSELWEFARRSIVFSSGDMHTRLKRSLMPLVTSKIVNEWRPRALKIARMVAQHIGRHASVDLIEDYAAEVPTLFLGEILGLSEEDSMAVARAASSIRVLLEPRSASSRQLAQGKSALETSMGIVEAAIYRLKNSYESAPLLHDLIACRQQGEIDDREVIFMSVMIYVAGHETTVALIGNALLSLATHPMELSDLIADGNRASNIIRETLRFESPLQLTLRQCQEDTKVRDKEFKAGSILLLCLGSANHDESIFKNPEHFDSSRSNSQHFAFGGGLHSCLGMFMATVEAEAAIVAAAEILSHRLKIDPENQPQWSKRSMLLRALESFPSRSPR